MLDHIHVGCNNVPDIVSQVPGYRQGLKKHFRKQNCTAEVQDYSSAVHPCNRCGKDPEVPEGSVANGSSVGIRVLVDYIGSKCHMNRIGNGEQKTLHGQRISSEKYFSFHKEFSNGFTETKRSSESRSSGRIKGFGSV